MDAVTLAIAVLGLVLSVVSIVWQIAEHRLSGARIKVDLRWGAIGDRGIVSGEVGRDLGLGQFPGLTERVFVVVARNVGRLPVDIAGVAIRFRGDISYRSTERWIHNPTLPHRLEAGSAMTFYLSHDDVMAGVAAAQVIAPGRRTLRGQVELATGKTLLSPEVSAEAI
jgi:hypothetical protein